MTRVRALGSAIAVGTALAGAACSAPTAAPDAPSDAATPWIAGPTLPRPSLEAGLAALGTQLVLLGGFDSDLQAGLDITAEVDELDTLSGTWTRSAFPDAPVQWTHIQLVGVDGTLYLLGGESGTTYIAHGDSFALDPGATAWRPLSPMPDGTERGAAGIVIAPPHIYLLGGASTLGASASCLDYDLLTDSWSSLPDLPAPRSHPAAMMRADGTLIVVGGLSTLDASEPLADVISLPLGGDTWTPLSPMQHARGGCAYGVVEGQLICAGGEAGVAALHFVESYDPNTDTWTEITPDLPDARAGAQGIAIGERLYIPGGANELQYEPIETMAVYAPL